MSYSKYIKTYKKLIINLFIYNIIIKLYKYIGYYSHYQINQIFRYRSYESL